MGNKEDLGIRIRTMRQSRGMTQAELAKLIGQSQSSITMYETGRREPEFDVLEALADVFNVPMSAFVQKNEVSPNDIDRLEALHQNPRLGLLFDRQRQMSSKDIEFMLQMADRILGERDGN